MKYRDFIKSIWPQNGYKNVIILTALFYQKRVAAKQKQQQQQPICNIPHPSRIPSAYRSFIQRNIQFLWIQLRSSLHCNISRTPKRKFKNKCYMFNKDTNLKSFCILFHVCKPFYDRRLCECVRFVCLLFFNAPFRWLWQ